MPSYYEVLGISQEATPQEIKRAYFTLAKRYHPDTSSLSNEEAQRKMAELNEAYAVLSSASQRAAYDSRSYSNFMYADPAHPDANPAYHLANLNVQKRCQETLARLQTMLSNKVEVDILSNLWAQLREDVEYTFNRLQEVGAVEPETKKLYAKVLFALLQCFHLVKKEQCIQQILQVYTHIKT